VANTKYEFTGETKVVFGVTLNRIRAVTTIAAIGIAAGDLGGWIEREENLRVSGNAWVHGNAWVYGDAQVSGNAQVSGDAQVYGDAHVYGDAQVSGNAWVYGNARVSGDAWVYGDARVKTVNVTATRTDGYTFLVAPTPDGPRIIAGCRYFTFKEAETHWGAGYRCEKLGAESRSIIRHLKTMAKLSGFDKPVKDVA